MNKNNFITIKEILSWDSNFINAIDDPIALERTYSLYIWYELETVEHWYEDFLLVRKAILTMTKGRGNLVSRGAVVFLTEQMTSENMVNLISFLIFKSLTYEDRFTIVKNSVEAPIFIEDTLINKNLNNILLKKKINDKPMLKESSEVCRWVSKKIFSYLVFQDYHSGKDFSFKNYNTFIDMNKEPTEEELTQLLTNVSESGLNKNTKDWLQSFIMGVMAYLGLEGIIVEHKKTIENKTMIQYSIIANKSVTKNRDYRKSLSQYSQIKYGDEYLWIAQHYSKIFNVTKPNKNSNKSIIFNDRSEVDIMSNGFYYMSKEDLLRVLKIIEGEHTWKFDDLRILIVNYQNELREVRIKVSSGILKGVEWFETNSWVKLLEHEISVLWNYYNLYLLSFDEILFGKKVYDVPTYEYRGRLYYNSSISFTTSTFPRYFAYQGISDGNESVKNPESITSSIIKNYNFIIEEAMGLLKISKTGDGIYEQVFHTMISIGAILSPSVLEVCIITYLTYATNLILNDFNHPKLKLKDQLALNHYIEILKDYSKPLFRKRFLMKDHTASVWQNIVRMVGPKNPWSLKIVNLNSIDTHYDTYVAIFNDYLKYENTIVTDKNGEFLLLISDDLKKRTIIKNPTMLVVYGASYLTCLDNVKNILGRNLSAEESRAFKFYYKYLKSIVEEALLVGIKLKKRLQNLHQNELECLEQLVISTSKAKSDIICRKINLHRKEQSIWNSDESKHKRCTVLLSYVDPFKIDEKKSKKNLVVHAVHLAESTNVVLLITSSGKHYFSIHDCYMTTPDECTELIETLNKNLKIKPLMGRYIINDYDGTLLYSIFIVR